MSLSTIIGMSPTCASPQLWVGYQVLRATPLGDCGARHFVAIATQLTSSCVEATMDRSSRQMSRPERRAKEGHFSTPGDCRSHPHSVMVSAYQSQWARFRILLETWPPSTYINRPFISLYHGLSWFYSLLLVLMDKGLGVFVCVRPRSLSLTPGLGSPLGSETVIWVNRSPAFLPSVSASLISGQGMEFRWIWIVETQL